MYAGKEEESCFDLSDITKNLDVNKLVIRIEQKDATKKECKKLSILERALMNRKTVDIEGI